MKLCVVLECTLVEKLFISELFNVQVELQWWERWYGLTDCTLTVLSYNISFFVYGHWKAYLCINTKHSEQLHKLVSNKCCTN